MAPPNEESEQIPDDGRAFRSGRAGEGGAEAKRQEDRDKLERNLRERVKELGCLFKVDAALRRPNNEWEVAIRETVEAIPEGFQLPDEVGARLHLGGEVYASSGFRNTEWSLSVPVLAGEDEEVGELEASFRSEPDPELLDRFLPEEDLLLRAIADRVGAAFRNRRAEDELRRREAYFRALAEGSGLAVVVTDAAGHLRYASGEVHGILGVPAGDLPSKTIVGLFPGKDEVRISDLLEAVVDTPGGTARSLVRLGSPDGDERLVDLTVRNLLSVSPVEGIVFTLRDLTKRKTVEDHRLQAHKMEAIGRLAAGLAHDFNNLFTVIRGYSEMMLEDLPEGSIMIDDLHEVLQEVQRASNLTGQLLAFSRNQILVEEVLDLGVLIQEMEPTLSRLATERVELRIEPIEPGWWVKVDSARMHQVVANLTANAADAIAEMGTITLGLASHSLSAEAADAFAWQAQPGEYVELWMEDTGSGMSPEVLDRIFEPFFTTKAVGEGAGLGLSTAYGIVKQSGGHILVESEPGKGSRFRILLPLVDPPSE